MRVSAGRRLRHAGDPAWRVQTPAGGWGFGSRSSANVATGAGARARVAFRVSGPARRPVALADQRAGLPRHELAGTLASGGTFTLR